MLGPDGNPGVAAGGPESGSEPGQAIDPAVVWLEPNPDGGVGSFTGPGIGAGGAPYCTVLPGTDQGGVAVDGGPSAGAPNDDGGLNGAAFSLTGAPAPFAADGAGEPIPGGGLGATAEG